MGVDGEQHIQHVTPCYGVALRVYLRVVMQGSR